MVTKPSEIPIKHYQDELSTHIFTNINQEIIKKEKDDKKEEVVNQRILDLVSQHFKEWNSDAAYQKRFFIVRNQQKPEALRLTISYKLYKDFLFELITNVYIQKYGGIDTSVVRTDRIENLEADIHQYYPELYRDLWGSQPIVATISLAELIDKVTDGEIVNTFCMMFLAYRYQLNLKLSPLSIAISFFNYKQLQIKKPGSVDETLYNKSTLPRLTYICFSGYFSELDIDVLTEFSENVQIIMIYDNQTGGPTFWDNKMSDVYEDDARKHKKAFDMISDKILLLPLDSSGGKINSRNLYDLFEYTVYRSIRKFRPDMVIINHPFNFTPENAEGPKSPPFILKPKTWSKILFEICVAANYKVMILPHKLLNADQYYEKVNFSSQNPHMKDFVKRVLPMFSQPLTSKSLEDYFVSSVEVMSRYKLYRNRRKKRARYDDLNYEYETSLNKVLNFYKDHPYYNHVAPQYYETVINSKLESHYAYAQEAYEKIMDNLSIELKDKITLKETEPREVANEDRRKGRPLSKGIKALHAQHVNNRVLLFNKDRNEKLTVQNKSKFLENLKECSLVVSGGVPLYPFKNSQYIVDYTRTMKLYYFNLLYNGKRSHFEFPLTTSKNELEGWAPERLNRVPWNGLLTKMGLCIGFDKIFVVYGQFVENDGTCRNSDNIYVYDLNLEKWLQTKSKPKGIISRHSVTCCTFFDVKTKENFLYVFGGDSDEESVERLNIYNIVEYYKINYRDGSQEIELEHSMVDKRDLYYDKVSYIPYVYSYAFQIKNSSDILILGGKKHSISSYETKSLRFFNYNHTFQRFLPQNVEVTEDRTAVSSKRDADEKLVIADQSRNMLDMSSEDCVCILSQNGARDYCVTQVTRIEKPVVCSVAHKIEKKPLIKTEKADKRNQQLFQTEDQNRIGTNIRTEFSQDMINFLRQETPEAILFLQMIVGCFENIRAKESSLNESLAIALCAKILSDEMFRWKNSKQLGRAALAFFDIVESFSKDSRINNSIQAIRVAFASMEDSLRAQNGKDEFRKLILQNKSKKSFIELLNSEVGDAMAIGALSKESVLKLDRVFQRALRSQEYHQPLYTEHFHRWFTFDLFELINRSEEQLIKFAREEDTGVLRDLIMSLGKLWIIRKRADSLKSVSVADLMKEKEQFWADTQIDKLSPSAKFDTAEPIIELDFLADSSQHQKLLTALSVLLFELAKREKVNPENLEKNALLDEKLEKWVKIREYFEIYNKLKDLNETRPVNGEKTHKMDIEREEPKVSLRMEEDVTVVRSTELNVDKIPSKKEISQISRAEVEESKDQEGFVSREEPSLIKENKEVLQQDSIAKKEGRRRGNKLQRESAMVEIQNAPVERGLNPKPKEIVKYHSIANLRECHSSDALNGFKFYLPPGGNEIHAVSEDKSLRAILSIYDANERVQLLYLDSALNSSIAIWNSAIFLYFDRNLADRYPTVSRQMRDCILYADLRESFTDNGKTKGMVVFSSVVKNDDGLVNRAIIVDEEGIYLIGGSRVTGAKKNPVTYSNVCSYYHLEDLETVSTDSVKCVASTMQMKRDNLVVTQNENYIFVASRDNWNADKASFGDKNIVEVYSKDDQEWTAKFEVPYEPNTLNYTLFRAEEKKQVLLFVGNRQSKHSEGFMIGMDEITNSRGEEDENIESRVKKISKFVDSSGGTLSQPGYEAFAMQNSYENVKSLSVRQFKREPPETEEYTPVFE